MIHSVNNYQLPSKMPILNSNTKRIACLDNQIGEIVYNGTDFESFSGDKKFFGLQRNCAPTPNMLTIQKRTELNYQMLPQASNPRIVILLESPNTDEYPPKNKTKISGPAMGSSGNRFDGQCITVFNNNIAILQKALGICVGSTGRIVYDVFFINAIQYQCSLGYPKMKPKIRDFIFEALWNQQPDSFRDDLIERLNLLKPNLIINACTRELQKTCCNGTNIAQHLKGFKFSFLTASGHICAWDKDTIIL